MRTRYVLVNAAGHRQEMLAELNNRDRSILDASILHVAPILDGPRSRQAKTFFAKRVNAVVGDVPANLLNRRRVRAATAKLADPGVARDILPQCRRARPSAAQQRELVVLHARSKRGGDADGRVDEHPAEIVRWIDALGRVARDKVRSIRSERRRPSLLERWR